MADFAGALGVALGVGFAASFLASVFTAASLADSFDADSETDDLRLACMLDYPYVEKVRDLTKGTSSSSSESLLSDLTPFLGVAVAFLGVTAAFFVSVAGLRLA